MQLIKHLTANEQGRDFVIGDLHGAHTCLERALRHVKFDRERDRLISVGDLVDRGPENEKCLRLLNEPWFHAVKGNHEDLMVEGLTEVREDGIREVPALWLRNGGSWAFPYFLRDEGSGVTPEQWAELCQLAYKASQLPIVLTVDLKDGRKFHVLHAEFRPYEPITDADLADEERLRELALSTRNLFDREPILWGRYIFQDLYALKVTAHFKRKFLRACEYRHVGGMFSDALSPIYSGHTPVARPARFKGQTDIDTGAFMCYREEVPEWAGLTITEPLTDSFWVATPNSCRKVTPVVLA